MNISSNDPIPVSSQSKIPRSLLWPLTIALIVSITIILILTIASQLKLQSRIDLRKNLTNILAITQGSINIWKKNIQLEHQVLSQQPEINQFIKNKYVSDGTFQKTLKPWMKAHNYLGFGIVTEDNKGKTHLLLANNFTIRPPIELPETFIIERHNDVSSTKNNIVMQATTPIKDQTGKTIAALVFLIDASHTFSQVTRIARLGESGETYALDNNGLMLTQPRFEVLNPAGHFSRMAIDFKKGKSGYNLEGYQDYRGEEVVGAWLWDKDLGLVLVTEIDKDEAYRSYEIITYMIWFTIFILIIGMTMILIYRETRTANIARIKFLQETDRTRKELLSVVSHDLKNPLSTLLMTNEILLRTLPLDQDFTEKRKKLLEKSHRAANQMRQLITDLLDASKIEAGKLILHPIQCGALQIVAQTIDMLEPIANEKKIALTHDLPASLPQLWADPERVAQILSNLVGNAIKFTSESGSILISAKTSKAKIEFSIRDTGIGIAKEELPYLFDRYWQSKKTQQFGTGLGLTICKQLVIAHGGDIWAESETGKGTTFYFTLPLNRNV